MLILEVSNNIARRIVYMKLKQTWTMVTSSNENIFRVTDPLCGEFTGPRWIPSQRSVTRSYDGLLDLRLNKRLSKQS